MYIEKIKIINYKIYRCAEMEFIQANEGLNVLIGTPGSGKTTLAQAIMWALSGEIKQNIDKNIFNAEAVQEIQDGDSIELFVILWIRYQNCRYKICRSLRGKKLFGMIINIVPARSIERLDDKNLDIEDNKKILQSTLGKEFVYFKFDSILPKKEYLINLMNLISPDIQILESAKEHCIEAKKKFEISKEKDGQFLQREILYATKVSEWFGEVVRKKQDEIYTNVEKYFMELIYSQNTEFHSRLYTLKDYLQEIVHYDDYDDRLDGIQKKVCDIAFFLACRRAKYSTTEMPILIVDNLFCQIDNSELEYLLNILGREMGQILLTCYSEKMFQNRPEANKYYIKIENDDYLNATIVHI